jgi:6-pyruvoyltetrahydropterin/6-carboxytetrahydropterin synthase
VYTLTKEFKFEAAHVLKNHDGKCARLHGHSWKGRVILQGEHLVGCGPKTNMLVDFGDISAVLKPLVDKFLDHYDLNTTLQCDSPTSEFVAKWVYDKLMQDSPSLRLYIKAVEIDETCTSSCRYEESK